MTQKLISIVIPAYNEETSIPLIIQELNKTLNQIKNYDFEVIFVDDGSRDRTWIMIDKEKQDPKIKWIQLWKNEWKEIAITSWIKEASWEAVITIDCDWQHPVSKIPDFIKEWENDYDMVYNKRPDTKWASFTKKLSSKLFYLIFNSMSEFKLESWTTDYRLLDRKVVDYYLQFQERNRLYRWLTDWLGFNKKELVFDANPRLDGKKVWNYSYLSLYKLAVNTLTSFSLFPLKIVGYLWAFITFTSSLLLVFVMFNS